MLNFDVLVVMTSGQQSSGHDATYMLRVPRSNKAMANGAYMLRVPAVDLSPEGFSFWPDFEPTPYAAL